MFWMVFFLVFIWILSLESCGIHKLKAIGLDKFMEVSRKESMEETENERKVKRGERGHLR